MKLKLINIFNNTMKKILYLCFLISILTHNGCTVLKRKYRNGFYVDYQNKYTYQLKKENKSHSISQNINYFNTSEKAQHKDSTSSPILTCSKNQFIPLAVETYHKNFSKTNHNKSLLTTNLIIKNNYNSKHPIKSSKTQQSKIFKTPLDREKLKALWEMCDLNYDTALKLVLLFGLMGAHYWYARKYIIGCLNTFVFLGTLTGIWMTILQPTVGLVVLLFYGIPNLIWWRIDVNRVKDGSFKPECNYEYRTPSTPSTTTPKSEPNTIEYSTPPKTIIGTGTGFFITNDVIVTNHHVIENAYYLYIYDKDSGKEYPLYVIAKDINNDLALLKSPEFKKDNIPFSISEKDVRTGDEVFTIGYPEAQYLGIEPKFADGKVSALTGFKDNAAEYQLTVPVHPGNSGSALFNKDGEIIGVINAKFTKGENVSYAIKKEALHNLLKLNNIHINTNNQLQNKSLQDKIDIIKKYTYIILIKQ